MRTFKAYFKKEMIESWRQYRYLILGLGFIFFAILDPLMLRLMPTLLKNQVPAEMLSMFNFNAVDAAQNYLKSLFQLVNLFVILGLINIISEELNSQRLVFPYTKGASPKGVVLAKFSHYSVTILICAMLGFVLNTYYIHLLFESQGVSYGNMLTSGVLMSVYYIFTIALLFLVSSYLKQGIVAGIIVLLFNYLSPLLLQITKGEKWIPHTLVVQSNNLGSYNWEVLRPLLAVTIIYIVIIQWLTIRRLKTVEIL